MKLKDGTHLATLSLQEVSARILGTTYRQKKLLQLTQVNAAGITTPARAYLATRQANTKSVVHGIPASVLEDEFRRNRKFKVRKSSSWEALARRA